MAKFDLGLNNSPNDIWAKIAQIVEQKGRWIAVTNLSPQALGR